MPITTDDFDYIRKLVLDRSAIVLEPGKEYLVESRMLSLLNREKIPSIEEIVKRLKNGSSNGLQDKVVDALTTNETSFFRDIHPFETFKKMVIPEILKNNATTRELNIWCGASSSGQEPYSIALILKNDFPQLGSWKIDFMSSDISVEMLDRCRRGAFSQLEVNRGLPAPMLVKNFKQEGMEWFINEDLRKLIHFKQINLSKPLPLMRKLDVIFLRNVLIYFDVETKSKILDQISRMLKPTGFLFLGAAETTLNLNDSFERVKIPQSGCYRLKNGSAS